MSAPNRRAMLDRGHPKLSIRRQCAVLHTARSGVYRPKAPANDNDLALMRRIDELYLQYPFLGSRRMAAMLSENGKPQTRAAAHAANGDSGARAEAQDLKTGTGAQDLSLSPT
jgi:putative transposase